MKDAPPLSWFRGINKVVATQQIRKKGLPPIIPKSLQEGFINWLSNKRLEIDISIEEGAVEYINSTYSKNLSWINTKKKNNLFQKISERDGRFCNNCKTEKDLTLDHVFPRSLGGPDTEENLRILCRRCNSSKGNRVQ